MRIKKWVTVETEIEVNITSEDIRQILEGAEESDSLLYIMDGLNNVAQFMNGIPPEKIAKLTLNQRILAFDFFRDQSARFKE